MPGRGSSATLPSGRVEQRAIALVDRLYHGGGKNDRRDVQHAPAQRQGVMHDVRCFDRECDLCRLRIPRWDRFSHVQDLVERLVFIDAYVAGMPDTRSVMLLRMMFPDPPAI